MALCSDAAGWAYGRAFGDAACAQCVQDHAGEDRPQGCPRHRRVDAAGLVPSGALQVDGGPGNARHSDVTQAGAEELHETEMSLRGVLRNFGLKVGKVAAGQFEFRIRELVEGHPTLTAIAASLLATRATLRREFNALEKRLRAIARTDTPARLLMSTPGVGMIVAVTYANALDDPSRFKSSKIVGAHFGMTPSRYQSGETDRSGRISKIGDSSVRAVLYEAAHVILTKPVKGCTT